LPYLGCNNNVIRWRKSKKQHLINAEKIDEFDNKAKPETNFQTALKIWTSVVISNLQQSQALSQRQWNDEKQLHTTGVPQDPHQL